MPSGRYLTNVCNSGILPYSRQLGKFFAILDQVFTKRKGSVQVAVVLGYIVNPSLGKEIVKSAKLVRDRGCVKILRGYVTQNGAVLNIKVEPVPHFVIITARRNRKVVSRHKLEVDHFGISDMLITDEKLPEDSSLLTLADILKVLAILE